MLVTNFFFSLIAGLLLVSITKKPLRYLFSDYGVAHSSESMVGKIATVSSGQVTESFGQADIILENGTNITIAVRVTEPKEILKYGQKILLTYFDIEKNIYWCERFE